MANVRDVSEQDFVSEVENGKGVYLVDFWAPWCGPCRMMAPILEEFSKKQNKIVVVKVNVDENQDLAIKYRISGIPTMLVIKDGKEAERLVGALPLNKLEEKLSTY